MFSNPLALGQDVSRKIRKPSEFEAVMANFVRDSVTNPLVSEPRSSTRIEKAPTYIEKSIQNLMRIALPACLTSGQEKTLIGLLVTWTER